MRPIMTRDELARHKRGSHGRDYSRSDDGYGDMEVAAADGWHAVPGWGRDGWDLGDWPYVVISVKRQPAKVDVFGLDRASGQHYEYEPDALGEALAKLRADDRDFYEVTQHPFLVRQTVEGDTNVYGFDTEADRDAAIDYLFIWYGLGRGYDEWAVLGVGATGAEDARRGLDAGTLRVPEVLRGPFSWARLDEKSSTE